MFSSKHLNKMKMKAKLIKICEMWWKHCSEVNWQHWMQIFFKKELVLTRNKKEQGLPVLSTQQEWPWFPVVCSAVDPRILHRWEPLSDARVSTTFITENLIMDSSGQFSWGLQQLSPLRKSINSTAVVDLLWHSVLKAPRVFVLIDSRFLSFSSTHHRSFRLQDPVWPQHPHAARSGMLLFECMQMTPPLCPCPSPEL